MPAPAGKPKADAGRYQQNPHRKPKLGAAETGGKGGSVPGRVSVPVAVPDVPPLIATYDAPKPEGAYFDADAAQRAVDFVGRLRHYQGRFAGQQFALLPWQDRLVRAIFGWKRADGTRLFRTVYLEVPRKAGKTSLAAAIALYLAYADDEHGPQVFFAAYDKDQAGLCYGCARIMAEEAVDRGALPDSVFYNSSKKILIPGNPGAELRVLSRDSAKTYGLNLHGLVFDELMTQPNRTMWDALTTSQGTREQPLVFAITTAGWDRNSVAYELREQARRVEAGEARVDDFLGVIYGADEDADWTDPAVWRAANPSLGATVDEDYYARKAAEAKEQPSAQNAFRTLLLSQWVGQATRLIDMQAWAACGDVAVHLDALEGRECFGGLDLASTTDLTAYVLAFGDDDGGVSLVPFIFIPTANIRERGLRDRAPYAEWIEAGYAIGTNGSAVDYRAIRATIREASEAVRVRDISYDRWSAAQLVQELTQDGFEMLPVGQGFASMSAPTKEMLRLVEERKLRHGNHPVLTWMADHAAGQNDAAGNVKLAKDRSTGRIDGLVAAVMAIDGLTRRGRVRRRSAYSDHEVFTV